MTTQPLRIFAALSRYDGLSMARDPLLRAMVLLPLLVAVAVRWILPRPLAQLEAVLQLPLLRYYPAIMGYALLLLTPVVCGMVVGFLLLDQRDDHTLEALQVTPLPVPHYLAYRLAAPSLLSLLMSLVALPLSGTLDMFAALVAAVAAAPAAPLVALFLPAFAANKVQGFALQKAMSLAVLTPALALFLPLPWRLLVGIVPTYWPAALLWELQAGGGNWWLLLLVALVYQALLLAFMLRRFTARLYGEL